MNDLNSPQLQPSLNNNNNNTACLLSPELQLFEPQAEDILTDEDLLDLFRIVKQVLRKNPDSEKLAKLLFCMSYALGDHIKFSKPCHDDRILFRDNNLGVHAVRLPSTSSCCSISFHQPPFRESPTFSHSNNDLLRSTEKDSVQKWIDSSSVTSHASPSPISPLTKLPSVSYLTNNNQSQQQTITSSFSDLSTENTTTDTYSVRPYSNFRPLYTATSSSPTVVNNTATIGSPLINPNSIPSPTIQHVHQQLADAVALFNKDTTDHTMPTTSVNTATINNIQHTSEPVEVVMEPHQRGFYYQDGRIAREPVLLQRYAEQGILTQASLMRKRKRHSADANSPFELSALPLPAKKPKIPHRHGEFEQRRDDIISRMRIISMADLEQKAQRLPNQFTLAIDQSVTTAEGALSSSVEGRQLTQEQLVELLEPALRILTNHSNMKPHLDNGMNQNGIYYNSDYFRLYLAFEQFQRTFAILFPNEVVKVPDTVEDGLAHLSNTASSAAIAAAERDKDRERNANMKAYRVWIEPLLTETNWAAFRRNIVVGERIMQLTKCVGQGVLLMTKELSGSKLHLTFTNSEWDEFINGLIRGVWDNTIEWEENNRRQLEQRENSSLLVSELQLKFATHYWFHSDGLMVSSKERRLAIHATTVASNKNLHRNSMDPSLLLYHHP
ncbi:hypothetical protein BDF21DRAFT_380546 [Thamnidium elegans]|uniref:Uncharacterized protein n=1 Tax=Thamnidium elegans TaxID=101142 RepID=A0A8H7VVD0_9FUNG|nr:hypothetical protein INT48_005391 [Thamnidium elegans]KAI8083450.1 hypothetical protein BDF21DRAFT_380546 [Thamnidium elegans]